MASLFTLLLCFLRCNIGSRCFSFSPFSTMLRFSGLQLQAEKVEKVGRKTVNLLYRPFINILPFPPLFDSSQVVKYVAPRLSRRIPTQPREKARRHATRIASRAFSCGVSLLIKRTGIISVQVNRLEYRTSDGKKASYDETTTNLAFYDLLLLLSLTFLLKCWRI